ncbi:MAG: biopolymer transporter ExbD [Betaproteobacteria bacterium]|nr:MAG: biopolymer transporter ExbD [Betaproteobacteria bacterium]
MAFGGFDRSDDQLMAEINTTPLVDVMLVLLVIFMVTAPLFTHAVRIDLPQAHSQPRVEKPDTVAVSIDADGRVRWNEEAIDTAELGARLARAAAGTPQPEVHLRAHRDTRYQRIAEVMSAAQRAGIRKLGFVTDPAVARRPEP